MQEQNVANRHDYRKYALLRALSDEGRNRIGICWMLRPSDGKSDPLKFAYLRKPARERPFDPELFDLLVQIAAEPPQRRLHLFEASNAIPSAIFYNDILPDEDMKRQNYMAACRAALSSADLVFLDPDIGIEKPTSKRKRSDDPTQYVNVEEIRTFYNEGKSLLIYQQPPRIIPKDYADICSARLREIMPNAPQWIFKAGGVFFLMLINPKSTTRLADVAKSITSRWHSGLLADAITQLDD